MRLLCHPRFSRYQAWTVSLCVHGTLFLLLGFALLGPPASQPEAFSIHIDRGWSEPRKLPCDAPPAPRPLPEVDASFAEAIFEPPSFPDRPAPMPVRQLVVASISGRSPTIGVGRQFLVPRMGASTSTRPEPAEIVSRRTETPPARSMASARPTPIPRPAPVRTPPGPLEGKCPAPSYPRSARARGEQGTVLVRLYLDPDGSVREAAILTSSGFPRLDEAAVETLQSWQFSPALEDGRAVAGAIDVPVGFRLE